MKRVKMISVILFTVFAVLFLAVIKLYNNYKVVTSEVNGMIAYTILSGYYYEHKYYSRSIEDYRSAADNYYFETRFMEIVFDDIEIHIDSTFVWAIYKRNSSYGDFEPLEEYSFIDYLFCNNAVIGKYWREDVRDKE